MPLINFAKLNTLVTDITIGSDDRNSIYLSLYKGNVATGSIQSQPNSICIRQVTTERAGAMRAQQVQDLNKCKSDISAMLPQLRHCNHRRTRFSCRALCKQPTVAFTGCST